VLDDPSSSCAPPMSVLPSTIPENKKINKRPPLAQLAEQSDRVSQKENNRGFTTQAKWVLVCQRTALCMARNIDTEIKQKDEIDI